MGISKEVEDILAEEQRTLDQTLELLHAQIRRYQDSVARESVRARDLTSEIVTASRAEDKQLLASDEAVSHGMLEQHRASLKVIEKLIKKPYFARIILAEDSESGEPRQIEYKIGYAANPDCRIIDWRKAPLSKLYYEYKEGDYYSETILNRERDGQIMLRHTIDIEQGKVVRLTCRYGTFALEAGQWRELAAGAKVRTAGGLPEIAALISPEQFKTITEDATTAVMIQGIAGSGKTTVALHRLAWLLNADNSSLSVNDAVVVVRSTVLKNYISSTLPNLGVEDVKVLTFKELAEKTIARSHPKFVDDNNAIRRPKTPAPRSISRLLSSMALLLEIDDGLDILEALSWPAKIIARDETKLIDASLIAETKRYLETCFTEGVIDPSLDPILVRQYQVKNKASIRHTGIEEHYEHIVVDEVQDWTSTELACIVGAIKNPSGLTLVGDVGQRITEDGGFPGWEKLREYWKLGDGLSKLVALTVSHRSTLPIMQLADKILGENRTNTGRDGRVPIWFMNLKESTGITNVIDWLRKALERFPTSVTAVICRDPAEAKLVVSYLKPNFGSMVRLGDDAEFSFEPGLVVTDVTQAKGLEFTNVLIWNPTKAGYPDDDLHRRMLYVAVTRAEENLCIVTWGKSVTGLLPQQSKLLRFYLEEPETDN